MRRSTLLALSLTALALLFAPTTLLSAPKDEKGKASKSKKKAKVEVKRLKKTVNFLAKLKPARNHKNVKSLDKAAAWLKKALEKDGYKVEEQPYDVDGKTYKNLITRIGPKSAPLVVIGAHYDVCGDQPGADDNASGVAGLLELARLLKARAPKLKNRLELVFYTLEEPPYFASKNMGSYVHAKSLADKKIAVKAMICLEMIGYFSSAPNSQGYPMPQMKQMYPTTANYIAVVGNPASGKLVELVKARMAAAIKLDVQKLVAPPRLKGIDFSDHRNYWAFGFPAVMVSDTSFYRNRHYHKTTDTPKTLDFKSMAQVVEGVYAAATQVY